MSNEFKQSLKFPEQNPSIRTAGESLFLGTPGSNPVHTTTFSSMLTENYGDGDISRYYQDLLMGSTSSRLTLVPEKWGGDTLVKDGGTGFKQKRPGNLVLPVQVSPVFNISPGFSPSLFLTSPTFLSPTLSPFGMSAQQTLAQLTAQAEAALSQNEAPNNLVSSMAVYNHKPTGRQALSEPASAADMEKRPPNLAINVDKPQDDGYNWRKYGQKQVKGSEYPRSYYRCTTANCPVKKKVERSFDGHITEIIYKGQHTHEPPQHGRRSGNKDVANFSLTGTGTGTGTGRDNDHCSQATCMLLHGPSDSEESGENYQVQDEDEDEDDDDPKPKKQRNVAAGQCDGPFTHRTMTEPKIVVQTRSEVDLLDDGYRWRKYGQKVVKGNPNPRSYYKCTTVGCKVRKHVERASTDPRAVITTYEGKHSHEVPAPRGTTINASNSNYEPQQLKQHTSIGVMDFHNKNQTPTALGLKQEQNLSLTSL